MTDAFPNYFSGRLTLSAANTFTTAATTLPINRIGRVSGTNAVVLEFLWMDIQYEAVDFLANADTLDFAVSMGSTPTAVRSLNDSDVLGSFVKVLHVGATPGTAFVPGIHRIRWETQDGHGLLVAAEEIDISGDSAGMAAASRFDWRIYYRFVNIPAMEMMGILQSQMG